MTLPRSFNLSKDEDGKQQTENNISGRSLRPIVHNIHKSDLNTKFNHLKLDYVNVIKILGHKCKKTSRSCRHTLVLAVCVHNNDVDDSLQSILNLPDMQKKKTPSRKRVI